MTSKRAKVDMCLVSKDSSPKEIRQAADFTRDFACDLSRHLIRDLFRDFTCGPIKEQPPLAFRYYI